jgi:hypothetical protein
MEEAFAGIDVACAAGKRLPVVVCTRRAGVLAPLPLRGLERCAPPRGMGNARTIEPRVVRRFAAETARYLRGVEQALGVRIVRIALDASSAPKRPGLERRLAEVALDRRRIGCFTTPDAAAFDAIRAKVRAHLAAGGAHARIPHANQLWMLAGFALFERLGERWPCLEVFPQAIAHTLGAAGLHKARPGAVRRQLAAAARHTGWPLPPEPGQLRGAGFGSLHDLLDAYLAAWMASLPASEREPLGSPPDDVIWIPRLGGATRGDTRSRG